MRGVLDFCIVLIYNASWSGADWPCLHLGNAWLAGKKTVIFTWEKGYFWNFYDFARAGPVGWKVIGKLPGPVFNPSPPLIMIKYMCVCVCVCLCNTLCVYCVWLDVCIYAKLCMLYVYTHVFMHTVYIIYVHICVHICMIVRIQVWTCW